MQLSQHAFIFYKKVGETPLQALDRLRVEKPELATETLSYIGRLDPLVEGELLVLVGEECKNREKYMHLDKIYEVDILFGVSTDTGDVLGKIENISNKTKTNLSVGQEILSSFIGEYLQKIPKYSSKNIKKVMKGDKITSSEKKIKIYSIENEGLFVITASDLQKMIKNKIDSVSGEFRQKEINEGWLKFFSKNTEEQFGVLKIKVHCGPGTYMRVLAEEIGDKLALPALALHIKRTKVLI